MENPSNPDKTQMEMDLKELKIDQRSFRIVDSRERGDENNTIRTRLLENGWIQKQLFTGDYMFWTNDYKRVGITRKTVDDLLGSIGKVFNRQLEEMLDFYDYNWILLEGQLQFSSVDRKLITRTGMSVITIDQVRNYLADWQHRGFMYDRTGSVDDTIHWLNNKYVYYRKTIHSGTRGKFADDRVMALPSGVRGKTGLAVLEKFGTLKAVANATLDQYTEVEGIGAKKAKNIFEHFNRKTEETGEQNAISRGDQNSPTESAL